MYVNHNKKIVFIHIPKAGGTAFKKMVGGFVKVVSTHSRLRECPKPERYKDYRVIAIVRDPYQRYVSAYRHEHREFIGGKTGSADSYLTPFELRPRMGEFLVDKGERTKVWYKTCMQSLGAYIKYKINPGMLTGIDRPSRLIFQVDFLEHPFLKPEVFKLEETDLSTIVPGTASLPKVAGLEGEMNYWGDYDWRDWIDDEGIELITEHCARDFKELGYATM